ncbi:MAG: amidohydrolase family protein [Planctomycetes bacterium]|nr:amidohydrolase family protein [Planctomycetota bacterium]
MKIVDTHAHIYSEDTRTYPLRKDPLLPPKGKGTLEHLKQEMGDNDVYRVVIVHTSTAYHWDNRLVGDVVPIAREFATGVCTLDPDDPKSPMLLEHYRERGLRGLRLYALGNPLTIESPGHVRLWEKCEQLGMVVCALINPPQLDALSRMLRRFPKVPAVLDHCANLTADDAPHSDNLKAALAMAEHPKLHAKVTFLVTGSKENYPCKDTHILGHKVIEAFGPDRCIWGSDFPCELWLQRKAGSTEPPKATYAQHLRIFTHDLGLDQATKEAVLGKTALKLWFGE